MLDVIDTLNLAESLKQLMNNTYLLFHSSFGSKHGLTEYSDFRVFCQASLVAQLVKNLPAM